MKYVGLLIGVILLLALFVILKPNSQTKNTSANYSSSKTANSVKTFQLKVEKRKLVAGKESLQVNQGDQVEIKITVDEAEELHLHGYDKSVDLEKNKEGVLKFIADKTGRFPYELEHSKTEIGALEVLPR